MPSQQVLSITKCLNLFLKSLTLDIVTLLLKELSLGKDSEKYFTVVDYLRTRIAYTTVVLFTEERRNWWTPARVYQGVTHSQQ